MDNHHYIGILQIGNILTGYDRERIRDVTISPYCVSIVLHPRSGIAYIEFIRALKATVIRCAQEFKDAKDDDQKDHAIFLHCLRNLGHLLNGQEIKHLRQIWICDHEQYGRTMASILLMAKYQITQEQVYLDIDFYNCGVCQTEQVVKSLHQSIKETISTATIN